MMKNYSLDDRDKIIDLVKFYSDWLYTPIDEELENKLYFIDDSDIDKHFYPKLKKEFEKSKLENKNEMAYLYGIKILENIKI